MDRGYYSAENINALFKKHLKFLCGTSSALSFAKEFIREIGSRKDHYEYYNSNLELYVFSKTIAWDYEQERPYKRRCGEGRAQDVSAPLLQSG